ncbi:hypothetical protein [Microbacterium radiodurans]|uniref:Uncharacterized protein n=1 Tax=Microbacterium radiodurans TaxID=661398 RepID=A0A5J5IYF0_9MICO|nr:hypothetical protein [Microbacterium radiodurans]KAA9089590.1 hypothetical protein F6B42_03710 [Microbacterium radiodurans]
MLLDITLSAMCSRARYRRDVSPVIEELRATAGDRTDILAQTAGMWAGYYERDATPELIAALLMIDGAETWIALGRRRRGAASHGAPIAAQRHEPPRDTSNGR